MKLAKLLYVAIALVGSVLCSVAACGDDAITLSAQGQYNWLHMRGNLLAQAKTLELGDLKAHDSLIINANMVDVETGTIRKGVSILIRGGQIVWVKHDIDSGDYPGVDIIDVAGRYVAPGLTDMHVHTQDDADYLLHLANGVTSIREMNGWGWRLERRRAVAGGKLLAPNMYVTSQILNTHDLGGYAIVIATEDEARQRVREAKAAGFDSVKIHNGLELSQFHAIIDEANSIGLDVIGHIPVNVPVADAIAAGLRTAEHFKGYIDDRYLEISEQDWLTPTIGADIYITPTFYSYREHLRGADVQRVIDEDADKVLPHRRLDWARNIDSEVDAVTELRQAIRPMSEEIFRVLLPHQANWLAGTDSGSYDMMVPGEALIEELEIMESAGLSAVEVIRSATTRAADAMRWSEATGRVAAGLSADLVVLDANPLDTVKNFRSPNAVMVRGIYLDDPASLPENGASLDSSETTLKIDKFVDAVATAERHSAQGYAQSAMSLARWASIADEIGETALAARLRALN